MADVDHRQAMRQHLAAIEAAIALVPQAPWPAFLAQRAALMAADEWLRSVDPPPEPELANGFGMFVAALLLAVEDVLRLFPEDPDDHPAPKRAGELSGQLLVYIRELLEDPAGQVVQ